MVVEKRLDYLKLSDRLNILYHLFHGQNISPLIDDLDDHSVNGFQNFMWEKTVEFGIECRGKHFDRREITRKMTPTPVFQLQQRCNLDQYTCKGTQCIFTNPKCARKKIKEHVEIMAQSIWDYIQTVKKREMM